MEKSGIKVDLLNFYEDFTLKKMEKSPVFEPEIYASAGNWQHRHSHSDGLPACHRTAVWYDMLSYAPGGKYGAFCRTYRTGAFLLPGVPGWGGIFRLRQEHRCRPFLQIKGSSKNAPFGL